MILKINKILYYKCYKNNKYKSTFNKNMKIRYKSQKIKIR